MLTYLVPLTSNTSLSSSPAWFSIIVSFLDLSNASPAFNSKRLFCRHIDENSKVHAGIAADWISLLLKNKQISSKLQCWHQIIAWLKKLQELHDQEQMSWIYNCALEDLLNCIAILAHYYCRFQNYAATTDKIHSVQFAINFRQSITISAFLVSYSEKLLFRSILINQLLQMRVLEAIGLRFNIFE